MAAPWSEREDAILRREVPRNSFATVAEMVGRSLRATEVRAHYIGVKRAVWSPWTDEDVALLREIYPVMANAEVADRLERSEAAIKVKVRELQLRKTTEYIRELRRAGATRMSALPRSACAQGRAGRFERDGGAYTATDDAVQFLRRIGPIWRCDADGIFAQRGKYWKFCGRIMDDGAVEARAKRSGWVAPASLARQAAA